MRPIGIQGRVVIRTVKDDIPDIGKNIVATPLRVKGYDLFDLGKDVSVEQILEKLFALSPSIVGLLTTTMHRQREVIVAIRKPGLSERADILMGGASTTDELAEDIGADGSAPDVVSAVRKANELLSMPKEA